MLTNIRVLIAACKQLDISFEILHPNGNLVRVAINDKFYYFTNSTTPFITHSISQLFKDKDYTYQLLKNRVNIPKSKAFLSPFIDNKYKNYLIFENIESIVEEIKETFFLPVIIKRNSGASGSNVFLCTNIEEVRLCIKTIFNVNSKEYDYVAIAQEYIDIVHEYRAVFFNNELLLLYEKNTSEAKFVGNLSPLHWEGAKAIHITEQTLRSAIENFVQPIFEQISVNYGGFDIAIDKNNKYWLIEINSHPNFDIFSRDNNEQIIIEMFKKMLKSLE